jgi:hypothetical protein
MPATPTRDLPARPNRQRAAIQNMADVRVFAGVPATKFREVQTPFAQWVISNGTGVQARRCFVTPPRKLCRSRL